MHIWLRTTLLSLCAALGVGAALAVALRQPPQQHVEPPAQKHAAAKGSRFIISPRAAGNPLRPADSPAPPPSEPTPVVAPYRDPVARQVNQLEESLQMLEESSQRRERSLMRAIAQIQDHIEETPPARRTYPVNQMVPPTAPGAPPAAEPMPPPADTVNGQKPVEQFSEVRRAEGDDTLSISIQNTDLRTVLETISRESGLNIIASKNVTGTVTANLTGVDIETALAAILKSTGYVAAREGNILYVGTSVDLGMMNQSQDRIVTRVYRPNYVKAADLQVLFTPLISPDGKITVSNPAQVGLPADQTKTGGNDLAVNDAVIVRDYETILQQLDDIFADVDTRPRQVAIEAMILSVKLSDTLKVGVNFESLRDKANAKLVSGTPGSSLGSIDVTSGGLHFGFLDSSVSTFIDCLEKVGDTNVIASPRLTCLNKQRAEIQIGEELGYVSTTVTESSSTQTINFLDVGTLLRIRPYISTDGLVRLEVHPELSTGSVSVSQGLSLPQKSVTQVTTNVLCPDGCTVVIGGLIREDLTTNSTQLPVLGNLPYVGWLFRQKTQGIDRNEIIVLITPRIVSEPFMCKEGLQYGNEFTQRQSVYFDKMSPIGKRNLAMHHQRLARAAYNAGDYDVAMKQINVAIHWDPQSRDNVVLRNEICAAGGFEDETIHQYLHKGLVPFSGRHHDYSKYGYPWKNFDGLVPPGPSSTPDQGMTGHTSTTMRRPPVPTNLFDPSGPPPLRRNSSMEPLPQTPPAPAIPPSDAATFGAPQNTLRSGELPTGSER